jgi:L-lactate dehydrogenase complex protein LldG
MVAERSREMSANSAREEIFASIRKHLAASAPFDAIRQQHHPYQSSGTPVNTDAAATFLLEKFQQGLELIGGKCQMVANAREAAAAVQQIITTTKAKKVALSDSPLAQQVSQQVDADVIWIDNASAEELFDCEIGMSGAQYACAVTSTLVLETDAERNRLCSLVPPIHIALVEAKKLLPTLGDALRATGEKNPAQISRAITFITGPSRTSDIELTLAIGVHGPQELHVIVMQG